MYSVLRRNRDYMPDSAGRIGAGIVSLDSGQKVEVVIRLYLSQLRENADIIADILGGTGRDESAR